VSKSLKAMRQFAINHPGLVPQQQPPHPQAGYLPQHFAGGVHGAMALQVRTMLLVLLVLLLLPLLLLLLCPPTNVASAADLDVA